MKILTFAIKESKEIFRETGGLLFIFMMPVALLIVFNLIFAGMFTGGGDRPLRVPLVNNDTGELATEIVKQLENNSWIKVETSFKDGTSYTDEDVIGFVQDGKRNLAVIFPPDFSEKVLAGKEISLPFYLDPGVPVQYVGPVEGSLIGALYSIVIKEKFKNEMPQNIERNIQRMEEQLGFTIPPNIKEKINSESISESFMEEITAAFEINEANLPVKLDKRQPPTITKDEFPTVYQQNLSGYSILSIFFIISALGSAFHIERERGTFQRILAAPFNKASFLVGKILPYIGVNFLQFGVLVLLSIVLYQTDLGQSPLALIIVTLCTSLAANGLGLLMVTIFNSRAKMESFSVVIVLISTALSGAFVPRFVMGEFMQQVSLAVPQSWALVAYQDVMVRGAGLIDVLPNCGVLLVFTTVFFLIGLVRFRYE